MVFTFPYELLPTDIAVVILFQIKKNLALGFELG